MPVGLNITINGGGGGSGQGSNEIVFGTLNNANEADYDTGASATPATDGPISISAGGVISLNTSSPTAGTYTVDGHTVYVRSTAVAIGAQSEFSRLMGSLAGLAYLHVREGAGKVASDEVDLQSFTGSTDWQGLIVLGDGARVNDDPSASKDPQAHAVWTGSLSNATRLRFRNIRFAEGNKIEWINCKGIEFRNCVVAVSRPNPAGGDGDTGLICVNATGTANDGIMLLDNDIIGGSIAARIRLDNSSAIKPMIVSGNLTDLTFGDVWQIQGANNHSRGMIIHANFDRRPAWPSSGGGVHGDILEMLGNVRCLQCTANLHMQGGNGLGTGPAVGTKQGWFITSSGNTIGVLYAGNGATTSSMLNTHFVGPSRGSIMRYNCWIPDEFGSPPFTGGGAEGKLTISSPGPQIDQVTHNICGETPDASTYRTVSNNVKTGLTYNATAFGNVFATYPLDAELVAGYDYKAALEAHASVNASAADGKVPPDIWSIAAGVEPHLVDVDNTVFPPPVLSQLSTPTGSTNFTATIRSDTPLNPIFYAVTPIGITLTDAWDVVEAAVLGAHGAIFDAGGSYGIEMGEENTDVTLTGKANCLSSSTQYRLHVVQFNASFTNNPVSISTATFTTS